VKALSDDPSADLPCIVHDKLILEYSLHWGVHSKDDLSDCAVSLGLRLFGAYDGRISAGVLADKVWY